MNKKSILLSKVAGFLFAGVCLLYGQEFFNYLFIYTGPAFVGQMSIFTWIGLALTGIEAMSFLISAVGCFIRRKALQKTGFGLMAFQALIGMFYKTYSAIYYRAFSTDRILTVHDYLNILTLLAYAVVILMAIRVPLKARLLGIIAALIYFSSGMYRIIAIDHGNVSFLHYLETILVSGAAIAFGLFLNEPELIADAALKTEPEEKAV